MIRADFLATAELLREPCLLVTLEGEILEMNEAARAAFQGLPPRGTLVERVADPAEEVRDYLARCSRVSRPLPGALTLRSPSGTDALHRVDGLRVASPGPPLVALRLRPRSVALAQFLGLNEKIQQLGREVDVRRRAEAAVREVNQDLARALAELALRTKELERANDELRRSNADLESFAYVASHDLQEPLRTVGTFAQLLAKTYRGRLDADADEILGLIVQGSQRMHQLIRDLLGYARIGRHAEVETVPLAEAVSEALADLEPAARAHGARIARGELPAVRGRRIELVQLFRNLLANALKFSGPRPAEVEIQAQAVDGFWRISVADRGIGFAPEYRERVFELFERLAPDQAGTGVGLAICRKVVEAHGGRIWAESSPGEGATFHFTLPGDRHQ